MNWAERMHTFSRSTSPTTLSVLITHHHHRRRHRPRHITLVSRSPIISTSHSFVTLTIIIINTHFTLRGSLTHYRPSSPLLTHSLTPPHHHHHHRRPFIPTTLAHRLLLHTPRCFRSTSSCFFSATLARTGSSDSTDKAGRVVNPSIIHPYSSFSTDLLSYFLASFVRFSLPLIRQSSPNTYSHHH